MLHYLRKRIAHWWTTTVPRCPLVDTYSMELQAIATLRSGSLGNRVFARNPQGPYDRARTIPIDPATFFQLNFRARFRSVVLAWGGTLTPTQRKSWEAYASRVTVLSRIGEHRHLSGQQMFVRCNAGRRVSIMGTILDAPTGNSLGTFALPGYTDVLGIGSITVFFDDTEPWTLEGNSWLVVYVSNEQTLGTNFFAGPYRFAGLIRGNPTTPPTSPGTLSDPFLPQTTGPRWGRARIAFADGRLTSSVKTQFTEI